MQVRWSPQVLKVLADLQADPSSEPIRSALSTTIRSLERELDLDPGEGLMWIIPLPDTGWVVMCSNDEPNLLAVTYLGPALEQG